MKLGLVQHWARVAPEHAGDLPMLVADVWYPVLGIAGELPDLAPTTPPGYLWLVADGLLLNVARRRLEVRPGPPESSG